MTSTNRQRLADQASQDNSPPPSTEIYGGDFAVQPLNNPRQYLTKYQQNLMNQEPTGMEGCQTSCGQCCMNLAPCFACCGCQCSCVYTLPTGKAGLVQAFGRFSRMLKPGINIINPCADQIRQVDLRITGLPVGRHPTITKDNVKVDVDASLSYRVTNPVITYYVLGRNLQRSLIQLTISSIRQVIGVYNLDQILQKRFEVSLKAKEGVIQGSPTGIKIHNVFIEQFIIPKQTQHDLTSAARQKRLSQAQIISNKADVESAELMKQSAKLLDSKVAMQIRYLQMVKNLGQKNGCTVLMDIGANQKGHK